MMSFIITIDCCQNAKEVGERRWKQQSKQEDIHTKVYHLLTRKENKCTNLLRIKKAYDTNKVIKIYIKLEAILEGWFKLQKLENYLSKLETKANLIYIQCHTHIRDCTVAWHENQHPGVKWSTTQKE